MNRLCPVCNSNYEVDINRLKHGRQTTCSRSCSYELRASKRRTGSNFNTKEYNQKYYQQNKKRIKEAVKQYKTATGYKYEPGEIQKEKSRTRSRAWYVDNKKIAKQRAKLWKKENPEKIRVYTRNYASRKVAKGTFTPKDYAKLKSRLLGRCGYCGENQANTIDHIVPLLRGGSNYIGNIMPACGSCNYSKQHKTLMEWKNGVVSSTRGARERYAIRTV